MLTAFATVENAIRALKEGASDFVKKPFENAHLIHIVNQCFEKYRTLKGKKPGWRRRSNGSRSRTT